MVERKRHLAKAITYRVFGSTATAVIAYVATGHAGIGAAVGVVDSLVKIGGYYIHERIWYRIRWGVKAPIVGEASPEAVGSASTPEVVVRKQAVSRQTQDQAA